MKSVAWICILLHVILISLNNIHFTRLPEELTEVVNIGVCYIIFYHSLYSFHTYQDMAIQLN